MREAQRRKERLGGGERERGQEIVVTGAPTKLLKDEDDLKQQ